LINNIYGSSRVGIKNTNRRVTALAYNIQGSSDIIIPETINPLDPVKRSLGEKQYELSNHLGNVLVTVSDRKLAEGTEGSTATGYRTEVLFASDYYPFGMQMPGREFSQEEYRYGFNGMEKDDEWKGEGNSYNFGARMYDSRIGRWLSVDAHASSYPSLSPYVYGGDNPILFLDPDGNDIYIYLSIGKFVRYHPMMQLPSDDKFAGRMIQALNTIYSTPIGKEVIDALNSDYDQIVDIKPINKGDLRSAISLTGFSMQNPERENDFKELEFSGNLEGAAKLLDNTMMFAISMPIVKWMGSSSKLDGVQGSDVTVLAHELWHAYQALILGSESFVGMRNTKIGGLTLVEMEAVGFGNYIRGSLFEEGDDEYGTRFYYSQGKPRIISDYVNESSWSWLIGEEPKSASEFVEGGSVFKLWREKYQKAGLNTYYENKE
jgi:RHS repeat-associated protein